MHKLNMKLWIRIIIKVVERIYNDVSAVELDALAAEVAASMITKHPDYALLAACIAVSSLHKQTKKVFSEVMQDLYNCRHPKTGAPKPIISKKILDIVTANAAKLNSAIAYDRDFSCMYFGFKTLEHSYLLKRDGRVV